MREPMIDAFTFKLYRTNLHLHYEKLDALTFKHSFHIILGFYTWKKTPLQPYSPPLDENLRPREFFSPFKTNNLRPSLDTQSFKDNTGQPGNRLYPPL